MVLSTASVKCETLELLNYKNLVVILQVVCQLVFSGDSEYSNSSLMFLSMN